MACTTAISELTPCVDNEGSYYLTLAYTDDDGAFTPTTVTWTLSTQAGVVINSRRDVSIATPSTSNIVVLTDDDITKENGKNLLFTSYVTYNSATYGNGLVVPTQVKLNIKDWIDIIPA